MSVVSLLVSAVIIGVTIVCAHGAFRDPEDLFVDDQELMGFFSVINGGGTSYGSTAAAGPAETQILTGLIIPCHKFSMRNQLIKSNQTNQRTLIPHSYQANELLNLICIQTPTPLHNPRIPKLLQAPFFGEAKTLLLCHRQTNCSSHAHTLLPLLQTQSRKNTP
uniref:Uncharacterized protein n=1 Tax=Cannabis sativa TaxID=3483 RepID=A0A803NUP9_CANSA